MGRGKETVLMYISKKREDNNMETVERTTSEVLIGMLKENTGSHFLDSGGTNGKHGYGRNHERNQGRDFESEKATGLSFKYSDIEITHNVYQWLLDRLEYSPEADAIFKEFAKLEENEDKYWPQIMDEFAAHLAEKQDSGKPSGLYADERPFSCNTYNGEDLLSQTLQYSYFSTGQGNYVVLQIHGGCDVRGGYTDPVVFEETEEHAMFDNARATIYCTAQDPHGWSTDDAYHWYDASYNMVPSTDLQDFEVVKIEDLEGDFIRQEYKNGAMFEGKETTKVKYSHRGVLVVDTENDIGYCPICGAELEGGY